MRERESGAMLVVVKGGKVPEVMEEFANLITNGMGRPGIAFRRKACRDGKLRKQQLEQENPEFTGSEPLRGFLR